ncbi:hypothetical protein INS49_004055 [Diaporthe citri]|uniref:uncharacterized protein n=1 Tax=Diaporthe citri TaxID=83186 RepID=UPI001C7F8F7B|nr:uncharacterized protein INS49_004055 [Diaporthe citri]KAG6354974.1 hypothetical protein INS49_004055 [Diaporthe citri]
MSTAMEWSYLATHPDEAKPPLPYKIGAQFTARACDLSEALVTHPESATGQTADDMQKVHPLEMCLRHTPSTHASPDADAIRFQIVDHVRESFVYEEMKPLWGSVIPCFYGSFTVEVPVPERNDRTRLVNAILYEHIPGVTLADIIPEVDKWSQDQRMEIMRQVIMADSKVRQVGIEQSDLMPRNIIVTPPNDQAGDGLRIRLIDFDYAFCTHDSDSDVEPEPETPSRIFERWSGYEDFANNHELGWLVDWPWEDWLRREISD